MASPLRVRLGKSQTEHNESASPPQSGHYADMLDRPLRARSRHPAPLRCLSNVAGPVSLTARTRERLLSTIEEGAEHHRTARVLQLPQRLCLNLADAFAGD